MLSIVLADIDMQEAPHLSLGQTLLMNEKPFPRKVLSANSKRE